MNSVVICLDKQCLTIYGRLRREMLVLASTGGIDEYLRLSITIVILYPCVTPEYYRYV